jgi:GMP synthase (glutamine-hydrolysing)
VLIVLHQQHSSPGRVGCWFRDRGFPLDIRRPRFGESLPKTLAHHAGAVIFGGPMSANDPDDYMKIETEWIGVALKEKKPFLGICLGAQMLARHLGASVSVHPDACVEIGYKDLEATVEGRSICAWPRSFYQWHREGFELPAGSTLLARSRGAFRNQAFLFGSAAVGVQFHPEITYAQVHRWTGYNPDRLWLKGAEPRDAQVRQHVQHGARVGRWLDDFLPAWLEGDLEARCCPTPAFCVR